MLPLTIELRLLDGQSAVKKEFAKTPTPHSQLTSNAQW